MFHCDIVAIYTMLTALASSKCCRQSA